MRRRLAWSSTLVALVVGFWALGDWVAAEGNGRGRDGRDYIRMVGPEDPSAWVDEPGLKEERPPRHPEKDLPQGGRRQGPVEREERQSCPEAEAPPTGR